MPELPPDLPSTGATRVRPPEPAPPSTPAPPPLGGVAKAPAAGVLVGRLRMRAVDASSLDPPAGKWFRGELWFDPSLRNQDTALGLETGQWVPVVAVDAALPPSEPPPEILSYMLPPAPPQGPRGPQGPPGPQGPKGDPGPPGETSVVQVRDFSGSGVPCPNQPPIVGAPTPAFPGGPTIDPSKFPTTPHPFFTPGHANVTTDPATGRLVVGGHTIPTIPGGRGVRGSGATVASTPVPTFGDLGSPFTLEGWLLWSSLQARALHAIIQGAFGGPEFLASNLGVVHKNTPQNPPAPSRIGAHWTPARMPSAISASGEITPEEAASWKLPDGAAAVELGMTLDAPAGRAIDARVTGTPGSRAKDAEEGAPASAVLHFYREHRGDGKGSIDDGRPLFYLDNHRGKRRSEITAPIMRDADERFEVSWDGDVRCSAGRVHYAGTDDPTYAFEVAKIDPATGVVLQRDLDVNRATGVVRVGGNTVATSATTLSGDLTGTIASATVAKLTGRTVLSTLPNNNDVLTWVAADTRWAPVAPSGGGWTDLGTILTPTNGEHVQVGGADSATDPGEREVRAPSRTSGTDPGTTLGLLAGLGTGGGADGSVKVRVGDGTHARTQRVGFDPASTSLYAPDGTTKRLAIDNTGIGFFATPPIAKPEVTGSRGGNAALASALTALASLGLLTDSST